MSVPPSSKAKDPRHTRAWAKLSKQVAREEPVCWLQLPGCTHWSTTADHVIPFKLRPDLCMVRSNLRGACEHCNKSRQAKPPPVARAQLAPALEIFD
ncbi:MAG TPA: hypothetical protein VFS26_03850 [Solirubrobacterales bacterium]|nr:hypothetical protein [Solirubrobacterales bacterium]